MSGTVLVVGASGLVGTAPAISFCDAGWEVIAASRRTPDLIGARDYEHLRLDLQDTDACAQTAPALARVTHVVYTAVYELPGLIPGWSDPEQIATNGRMLTNLLDPLCEHAKLEHVTILQGTKAYGPRVAPMRVPAREDQPRVEHPNFYWLHEDYITAKSKQRGFDYTILRPQLIVGPNHGVVMNLPPVIGVFAAMLKHEGQPLCYPGGGNWVWEVVDARLVGDACLWAAQEPGAARQTYNLTNGEVFLWRDMWPAIARTLGMAVGPDEPRSIAAYVSERAELWEEIVQQHNLQPLPLDQILGESHYYADMAFSVGATEEHAPIFVSTVKIKQAGFTQTCNSEESFCHWLADLQARRIIPRPG